MVIFTQFAKISKYKISPKFPTKSNNFNIAMHKKGTWTQLYQIQLKIEESEAGQMITNKDRTMNEIPTYSRNYIFPGG